TSLEMRPDGRLLSGVDLQDSLDIFTYDVTTLQIVERVSIPSQFDPDDIACAQPSSLTLVGVCRVVGGGDTIYLVYAYQNRADENVEALIGEVNHFNDSADRGQPRWFPPGNGAFQTILHIQSEADTWTLEQGSITGDATTRDCQQETTGSVEYVIIN